jgi:hypothetical protein
MRIEKGTPYNIQVKFTATEWDQNILDTVYADTRMDNLTEQRIHTESNPSAGFNDGERWITLGTGDLQFRLIYTITSKFYLGVEVEEDGRWVRQGHLIGGGPIIAETRVIPLDLSRVTGDHVRIRLHPPIGFWMFNAFRLAEAEVPVHARVLAPLGARDGAGRDVRASLVGEDRSYLTFATQEDLGIVDSDCPRQAAGTERTVFARTRGWYEIHVRASGFPDLAEIARVTDQPGYPVQLRQRADRWVAQAEGGGQRSSPTPGRN